LHLPSPLQQIEDAFTQKAGIKLFIKRDDLIHPVISGNKWRKLHYPLGEAVSHPSGKVVSVGGAHSNHLHALAFCCQELGLKSVGIVRANEWEQTTPSLRDCMTWGMQIWKPGRAVFDSRHEENFQDVLKNKFGDFYWINDGGDHPLGEKGCAELVKEIPIAFDHLCCPVGTGTTLRGISLATRAQLHGYLCAAGTSVIKANAPEGCRITEDYCEGGFGKISPRLKNFMEWFQQTHHIELDRVYTGKMMMGIYEDTRAGVFRRGETLIAIHTGGLQGNRLG
ncbi:MAG: pyridoxal-phosphate dependent enzyme, partial [Cytophagaceae bacterium]|nr:pyridoxal-phosphate dependent enzyme [Cytophagaceae bacterium]